MKIVAVSDDGSKFCIKCCFFGECDGIGAINSRGIQTIDNITYECLRDGIVYKIDHSVLRSYKILEVSKNYKMSKESQIIFDQFIKHNLGEPWTDSEEYQRGLVIDKIMEMIND